MRVNIFSYVFWPVVLTLLSNACLYLFPYFTALSFVVVVVIVELQHFLCTLKVGFIVMCFPEVQRVMCRLQLSSSQERLVLKITH